MSFLQDRLSIQQMVGIATAPNSTFEMVVHTYRQYYYGDENVTLSDRQKQYIPDQEDLPKAFSNAVKLVVSKIKNRTRLESEGRAIQPLNEDSEPFADLAKSWWQASNIDMQQSDLMTHLLRDGIAGLFVQWSGESNGLPVFLARPVWTGFDDYNGQSGVRFHTADVWGDSIEFASYRWQVPEYAGDGETIIRVVTRLDIYEPGYNGQGAMCHRFWSEDGTSWTQLSTEQILAETGQPYANPQELLTPYIPIVKFENTEALSEVRDLIRLESLRQKSIGDVDEASDYHAMPALAVEEMTTQIDDNGQPVPLKVSAGYTIVAPGAKRIEGADLQLMWQGTLRPYLMEVGLLKQFPVWILNPETGQVPSGVALKVQERDLVAMITDKQSKLVFQWQLVFHIAKWYYNAYNQSEIDLSSRLKFIWVNPATEAVIEDMAIEVSTAQQAGLSAESIWRNVYGYDDSQVEEEYRRLAIDTDNILKQAQIIDLLVRSTLSIDGAIEVAGLSDEQKLALTLFGNSDSDERTRTTAADNRQDIPTDQQDQA